MIEITINSFKTINDKLCEDGRLHWYRQRITH